MKSAATSQSSFFVEGLETSPGAEPAAEAHAAGRASVSDRLLVLSLLLIVASDLAATLLWHVAGMSAGARALFWHPVLLAALATPLLYELYRRSTRRIIDTTLTLTDAHARQLAAANRALSSLRDALDMHAIVAVTDRRGVITYVNDRFCEISGYTRGDLIGATHRLVNSGTHPPGFFANLWATISSGRVWSGVICNCTRAGTLYWVDSTIVPVLDERGRPHTYIAIRKDVTQHHLAEEQLRVSERRRELVLEASDLGAWDWNVETDENLVDGRWSGMLGYAPEALPPTSATWRNLLHPDDLDATMDALHRHLDGIDPDYRAEFRMRHRDGYWLWVLARGRVVARAPDGHATRMAGTHMDIGREKALEESLLRAKREAEDASLAKTRFVATMSHEIRTPMNSVIGFADLLAETALTPEQRRYTEVMRSSGEQLLRLIDDILDFAKVESGMLVLESVPFDPQAVLADITSLMRVRAHEKSLALTLHHEGLPPQLLGDPTRLRQVLLNLLANALKFTQRGSVTVDCCNLGSATAPRLRVEVRDTGIGIAPDRIERLFQDFQQADSSTTRHFGGSGLGLAISRRIVEAMGGVIGATSTPGEGSTFWFELPLRLPGAHTLDHAHDAPAATPTSVQPPLGLHVLVAEDNAVNRTLMAALLPRLGCTFDLVDDGAQALHAASVGSYDAVLMDCHMPTMDGLEATRRIRAEEATRTNRRHVPIIALTASVTDDDRRQCMHAGMDDYLAKPVRRNALRAALERAVARTSV